MTNDMFAIAFSLILQKGNSYSPKLLVETIATWQDLNTSLFPTRSGLRNDCVQGDLWIEQAQCTNLETGQVSGSHYLNADQHSQRLTVRSQATLYKGWMLGANHQFKFGVIAENERFVRDLDRRPDIDFVILDPLNNPEGQQTA